MLAETMHDREDPGTETPDVSVVIPNYRRPDLVRTCLASVRSAAERSRFVVEVIVVDDGSGDGAVPDLEREHPWVMFVALPDNLGYPGAVNAGIAVGRGRWLFTLNNDTTVDADFVDELLTAVAGLTDVGHLAAQQRFSHARNTICSAGLVLDDMGVNSERLIGRSISESERVPTPVFGACGGAAAYRREMLEDVGLLDESFRFGLEDADLAWRAQMAGWRCLYVPDSVIYHDYGGTVAFGTEFRWMQAGRNRVRLLLKNLDDRTLVRKAPKILAYDIAYVLFTLIRHRTLAPLRGRLEVLVQWRSLRRQGAAGRKRIELAPALGFRDAMRRRRAWLRA